MGAAVYFLLIGKLGAATGPIAHIASGETFAAAGYVQGAKAAGYYRQGHQAAGYFVQGAQKAKDY